MKPNNFTGHPYGSVLQICESEIVARNIMIILSHTGNKFRLLGWGEYHQQRKEDGNFTMSEKTHFDLVVGFCTSAESAEAFCPGWADTRKEV